MNNKNKLCKKVRLSVVAVNVMSLLLTLATPQILDQALLAKAEAFTQNVGSGVTVSGESVEQGTQTILSGGTAQNTTLSNWGYQNVQGIAQGTIINSEGFQTVQSGGEAEGTIVNSDSLQYIEAGGVAEGTIVNSGGLQQVDSGGVADHTQINDGVQQVMTGGVAQDTTVNRGGLQQVDSGGLANHTQINDGVQQVMTGGVAKDTTINNKGIQNIYNNGKSENTTVNSGGYQEIQAGGVAKGTTIKDKGIINVLQGGKSTGIIQESGGAIQVTVAGADTETVVNGKNANGAFELKDGVVTNFILENYGYQDITVGGIARNTTINQNGQQAVYAGGKSENTTINQGGIVIVSEAGAQFAGRTINQGEMYLSRYDGNSGLHIEGSGGLVFIENVDANDKPNYNNRININSLQGSQTFSLSADLANNTADQITITDSATGTHYIRVDYEKTASHELPNLTGSATVVTGTTGAATFAGTKSDIDGVSILPTIVKDANSNNWLLIGYNKVGTSKLALGAYAAGNMSYAAVLANDNNLQRRMGELRENTANAGIWLRTYGGEYSVDHATMKHFTIQGGYDWVRPVHNGKTVTGITLEHQNASNSYDTGNGKLTNTRLGVYHTWLGDSGHYYDLIAKTGRMSNKYDVYSDANKLHADYSTWNTTLSAEYGYTKQLRQGYYIRPQAELTYSRINGANYTADNATTISQDTINSLIARIGINVGRQLDRASYYLGASLLHEFMAKNKVTTGTGNFASTLERDLKGTAVELSLGGSLKTGAGNTYLEASRSFGGKVTNKWQLQAGYRYNF